MRFKTRESAEEFIISRKAPRISTNQHFEIVRCAFELEYRIAVYNVKTISPFQSEFSHYLKESVE